MRNNTPAIQGHTIVLVGHFNPVIFQPAWFAKEKLIKEKEAEEAKIEVIHSSLVNFNIDNWLDLQVSNTQFAVSTTQVPYYEVLRDLVIGTFRILRHTPLSMMGINWQEHIKMDSEENWHKLGDLLAPKAIWQGIMKRPGMKSLTIESPREDGLKGAIRIKVEPSVRIAHGSFFSINDHYESQNNQSTSGSDEIINMLEENWQSSLEKSEKYVETILGELLK